jgi:hypothetical protein
MLLYNVSCPAGLRPGFTYQSSFGRHRTRRACSLIRLVFLGRMGPQLKKGELLPVTPSWRSSQNCLPRTPVNKGKRVGQMLLRGQAQ